jgi:hypothetical protein
MVYRCGNCASSVKPEYRFCVSCGAALHWEKLGSTHAPSSTADARLGTSANAPLGTIATASAPRHLGASNSPVASSVFAAASTPSAQRQQRRPLSWGEDDFLAQRSVASAVSRGPDGWQIFVRWGMLAGGVLMLLAPFLPWYRILDFEGSFWNFASTFDRWDGLIELYIVGGAAVALGLVVALLEHRPGRWPWISAAVVALASVIEALYHWLYPLAQLDEPVDFEGGFFIWVIAAAVFTVATIAYALRERGARAAESPGRAGNA